MRQMLGWNWRVAEPNTVRNKIERVREREIRKKQRLSLEQAIKELVQTSLLRMYQVLSIVLLESRQNQCCTKK